MTEKKQENETKDPKNQEPRQQPETPIPAGETAGEVERLRQKIEELQKTSDSLKDQLLRRAAEFENYKRRVEADFGNLIRNANEGLLLSLIPILNDFVRSMKLGKELKDHDAFFKGVELIHNKLTKVLETQGLVPFASAGKPFDVDYHDALLQIPRSDLPPHTVIEEVERGYMLNDRVLRHAKVVVSSEVESPAEAEKGPQNGGSKVTDA